MPGMDELEGLPEPPAAPLREPRHGEPEVVFVLVADVLRLVQKLHLGHDDRDAAGSALGESPDREPDTRITTADPETVLGVVQEELPVELVRGLPRVRGQAAGRAEEHLVDGALEVFFGSPFVPEPGPRHLVPAPIRVDAVQGGLVVPEDADLEILVVASDLADEEVDRPPAADEPGMRVAL